MELLAKFHFIQSFSKERWLKEKFTSNIAFNSQEIVENTQMKWMKIDNHQNAINLHLSSPRKNIHIFAYSKFIFFLP